MSSEYNYDDQGQFFPYFVLTIAGLITGPLTYNILKPSTKLEQTAARIETDFRPKDDDLIQVQKRRQRRKERKVKRMIVAAIGYAIMAYMIYLIIVTQRTIPKLWDPYEILGVSRRADERAIDKHFKKLSIKYHPDKAKPDPAKNETLESINNRWVEMTKAYKALTDEEIRNNYLQYGHPDGKQSFSIGIALPKLLVMEGSGKYVLLFYALLLGVVLPYTVGRWWYGTQKLTKDKVLLASAGNLFREYKEDMSEGATVSALSVGDEFKEMLKGDKADKGASRVEKSVTTESTLPEAEQKKLKEIEDPVRRKTLSLLWAYLNRVELNDPALNEEKYEVAPTALRLNNSLSSMCLGFGLVSPLMSCYRTSQNLIQAMPPNAPPLLQLPYMTRQLAKSVATGAKSKSPLTVQQFMSLPPRTRRTLCSEMSDAQYDQVMRIASQIPTLQVEKAFFKVQGDRVITPSSLVQLVVKCRIIPPGTPNVPSVDPLDLEDIDPDEDDLEALLGRKPAKNRRRKNSQGELIEDDSKKSAVQPPLAFAPYFARDHSPRWHIFLADARQGRIGVPPFTFTAFDRAIFDEQGKPTFNVQTLKCQFAAPPQVGQFPFIMHVVCDSYVGFDSKQEIILDVRDVKEAEPVESEDEISEPDEDSLAGQLQAMKQGGLTGGGGARSSSKKNKASAQAKKGGSTATATAAGIATAAGAGQKTGKVVDESSEDEDEDDESDTDGDSDDTSETDTETESEGE